MAHIQPKKIVPPAIVLSDSAAKKEPRYIIPEVIEAAYEFPGESIPLANEDLVDKSYAPQILKQARRVDENFNVYFSLQKKGYNNTASGKSWYYKGIAYLVYGELEGNLPEHTEVVEMPKAAASGAKAARVTRQPSATATELKRRRREHQATADEVQGLTDEQLASVLTADQREKLAERLGFTGDDLFFGDGPTDSELLAQVKPKHRALLARRYREQSAATQAAEQPSLAAA